MPADVQKVRALFLHAVGKLPPEQWDGYVAEACGEDAELGRQVGRLLQVHREAGSFLDRPAAALEVTAAFTPAGDAAAAVPLRERPGTVIGPYKLLQQIGEGGMGAVFMAEQTHPVRRMVALKVIKAGMDSRQVIARFEAERQALAMMDHINIARVLDAGATESGLPYFVMELVHGVPITKYCDDNHLTPRERLELFVPVCQAIQHAHQKGVIHRDVKPSNVMITLYDGKPVPKVIDFGVAKAIDQRLTEGTLFTQYGAMVGTLEYMSPEQAEMSALGVDTRSDVYSLGVLLYELLTGGTPLSHKRIREAAYGEVLRMIKEEEPPRPSTRLNDSGEALVTISAQRHMEPAKLAKLVRGELDWIVMKTLEKDRNRRYATASGFAADVQRYLNDEPVQAYPPTAGYRFRKFARRNKRILATVGLLALALTTGTVVSAWQAIRATEAEGLAQTRLQAETEAQHATRAQLLLTEEAQEKATRGLYEARVAQAQAIRLGGRIGQRFQSLDILTDATQMARYMNLFEDDSLKLRNEAIGCLALPDIGLAKEWPGWPEGSRGLAFDGALERYARLDQQGIVSIRRVADDAELWSLPGMGPDAASNLSPDGQFFALHHPDNRFQVWKLAGKEPVELLNGTGIFAFSPDSRQCASSRADGSLWLYELPSGRLVKQLALGVQASSLAFHPRDEQLALSCEKGVQVRDLRTGDILAEFPCNNAEQLAWHPDGETLAVLVAPERTIHICERATLKTIIRLEGSRNDGIRFAFNRTGDVLASICWDARLRLWDPRTGLELFSTAGLSLTSLRFSSDKDLMAAGVVGDKLQLWKVGSAPCYRTLLRNNALGAGYYHTVAIHPNGRLLAVGMGDGADLWDLATGKHLQWIKLAPGTNHVL
ncbi:MAG TPA: serine/threonine-protein kinase, partial [Gemmataceae bacterium]|nr:serine/threonine-protein kinase [Gemmataceae bacterium]